MKSFSKFVQEAKGDGASPYEVYKAPAQPTKPSPPPADFRDKYLPKSPVQQAQMVPPKTNTPLDLRTPAQKLLQLQQLRKQNPTV